MTYGSELPSSPDHTEAAVAPSPTSLLRVAVSESRPGVLVVSPVGEVDVASADVLREAAQDAVAAAPRCLVIDLGGITFCGSTGLVVLLDASRSAAAAGVRFRTVDGPPIVRRVLEITQLGPVLGHQETLDDAVRDLIG
jgi:stage II sporulation protein AA (anti-sigma F factor antagonist)